MHCNLFAFFTNISVRILHISLKPINTNNSHPSQYNSSFCFSQTRRKSRESCTDNTHQPDTSPGYWPSRRRSLRQLLWISRTSFGCVCRCTLRLILDFKGLQYESQISGKDLLLRMYEMQILHSLATWESS